MRKIILGFMALSAASLFLYSCNKSESVKPESTANTPADLSSLHGMGLNAMQPSDWAGVPAFSANLFKNNLQTNGLTYGSTLPASYLLVTPQIRDQGQIGACTGFCGAESDEILYYYSKNSPAAINPTDITAAPAHEIPNTSDEPAYGGAANASSALSPLFLYFTERVVVNHGSISTDPGANMVNIGEALQGKSNNTSTGTLLTYNSYTFNGLSTENEYPYAFVAGSGGYNVATTSNGNYKTYPYDYYKYASTTIPGSPSYSIGAQGGSTTSTGATTSGYYVITSTGSALVNDIKTALVNNKPVMMGFNVYDKSPFYPYFENLSTTSYTYNPLNSSGTSLAQGVKLMGGHAVPIVGYINGYFICQNSWGTPWGYHGYFYLPYSVVQNTRVVPAGSLYVMVQ